MSSVLESLGLTKEEIEAKIIDKACEQVLNSFEEAGDNDWEGTHVGRKLSSIEKSVKASIDETINRLFETHVAPKVADLVANLVIQATNGYGEKKGEPKTFTEYLTERANNYLTEAVDYQGKSKAECSSYGWDGKQTRITYLVHQHLQYEIERAMKDVVGSFNKTLVGGLHATAKAMLQRAVDGMKVSVDIPK